MENLKTKPITAITMGDPSGIGPEIVLKTVMEKEIYDICYPFIIGSIAILKRAMDIVGSDFKINKIEKPKDGKFEFGTIDVLETNDYDTDSVKWGEIQKISGQMSMDWILKSIELGKNKEIDAVSTAPIHKSAIKLVGVKQAGHSEIYQDELKVPYALTMFSVHKLKVFFVSRHMSLVDACKYADKERVLQDLINIDKELRNLNFENPLIALAALNPHGGDNGLFGREEIDELIPAVEMAKERGLNVVGPLPADSVFHIGKSGKFDAILSLYHDQGHIACKTYDFEKSVTVTFGLPFLRSSVDHGTAFDIAGKNIAGATSMIESTIVVSQYAQKKLNKVK